MRSSRSIDRHNQALPVEVREQLEEIRSTKCLDINDLDRLLAALDPELFDEQLQLVIVELGFQHLVHPRVSRETVPGARRKLPATNNVSREYLKDISAYGPMSREDEATHSRRMEFVSARLDAAELGTSKQRARCRHEYERVRAEFVERNLHLVVSQVYAYRTYGVPLDDLIQEGNAALMRAAEKFDWRRGVRFRTYVTYWIRQAVERSMAASKGIVRVPHHLQQKFRRLKREGKLPAEADREPAVSDVADGFEISRDSAARLMEASRISFSLDQEISPEGESYRELLVEDWEPEDSEEGTLLHRRIEHMLAELDEREQRVLRMRFGLDGNKAATLEEVGNALELSRERSRQIQQRALGKLRSSEELALLEQYL